MKNEQQNNQPERQGQGNNASDNQYDRNQQQGANKSGSPTAGKNDQPSSQKSNISVNNDGKIGKDDQWQNDSQSQQQKTNKQNNQVKNDQTITEPEIDAPIYDPEKTEKKIPQMESNKNSK